MHGYEKILIALLIFVGVLPMLLFLYDDLFTPYLRRAQRMNDGEYLKAFKDQGAYTEMILGIRQVLADFYDIPIEYVLSEARLAELPVGQSIDPLIELEAYLARDCGITLTREELASLTPVDLSRMILLRS